MMGGMGHIMSGGMMGGGLFGMLFALVFWVLVIALIVALVVWIFNQTQRRWTSMSDGTVPMIRYELCEDIES